MLDWWPLLMAFFLGVACGVMPGFEFGWRFERRYLFSLMRFERDSRAVIAHVERRGRHDKSRGSAP